MLQQYPHIFVTGGTGWLGQRVVQALTSGLPELNDVGRGGQSVRCLVPAGESSRKLQDWGTNVTVGSVNDDGALQQFLTDGRDGLVIHIAGLIHPPGLIGHTKDFERVNLEGTRNILQCAMQAGVKRLVVMSSNSPFGGNVSPDQSFTEDSPYNPYMGYGYSKWRMEEMLRQHMATGTLPEITILRAPWFYGPGQPPRQTLFFKMIKDGKFPLVGDGTNRRSMGYVDSLALGILLAAGKAEAANDIFWLADEKPYAMLEIIETVRAVLRDDFGMKVEDKTMHLPSAVVDVARLCDYTLQAAGLYQQKIHVLSEMNMTIACDIGKAKRVLGYQPLVALREGMRRSVQWCLDNNLSM